MLLRRTDEPRPNPFRYGDVATCEHFTDREGEVTEFMPNLRNGQTVLVMYPRCYGKTSLITAVMERIRELRPRGICRSLAHRDQRSASPISWPPRSTPD